MGSLRLVWIDIAGFRVLHDRHFFDLRTPRGGISDQIVVAGTNGGGKTSFLEAILFGLGLEDLILRDLAPDQRADHWRGRFPEGARVSLCAAWNGQLLRADREHGSLVWRKLETPDDAGVPCEVAFNSRSVGAHVEYFSSWRFPGLFGPIWPAVGGDRTPASEVHRLRTLKQRIADQRTLESYQEDSPTGSRSSLRSSWMKALNTAWAELHSGDGTRLADQPVQAGDAAAGFDLYVLERDGRRRCSVDHLSAGELELLCFAGVLTLNDFRGLLLIDEPELHLHPEWQRQILPVLRKLAPEAQIIATSHAAAPWDLASSYQRFFLAPTGDPRRSATTPPLEHG